MTHVWFDRWGSRIYRHDIGDYLTRWVFETPLGLQLRLHHIRRADADEELHNHPFSMVSVIFWGHYIEQRREQKSPILRKSPTLNLIQASDFHRITEVSPGGSWSFVIAGPRRQSWGFLTKAGDFVPWREFLGQSKKPGLDYPPELYKRNP